MELGQIEPGHSILNVVFIQNKMQTQNFTRPAYLIWYIIFQFLTIVYSVDVHHKTFLPQADFLFPQVEFVSFLMMILLKTDTKMHQRWNFFFKVKAGKNGACALLICPLNQNSAKISIKFLSTTTHKQTWVESKNFVSWALRVFH